MALMEDGSNSGIVMPVAPMGGNGNGGFGNGWSSDWIVLFLLFGLFGGWGNGFGGFGGGGNFAADSAVMYPWMNQSNQINNGFRDQMLNSSINGIQGAITSGFGDTALGIAGINQNICQTGSGIQNAINQGFTNTNLGMSNGFNSVNAAVNGAQNALAQQMYGNQIADLERSFAAQTANTQGLNALQSQLAQCCCDNRAGLESVKYTVATENCADRAAISDGIRDLLAATQAQTQTILTQLCNDKIEQKNDTIAQLRSELLYARGQASQDVQTAAIQAGQRALANEVEQYVAPRPIPSYTVTSPYCCQNTYGCGCGA